MQIDYDPTRITYAHLLDVFWSSHNPCQRSDRRQYLSLLFYHNEEQKKLARQSLDRVLAQNPGKVVTEILPYTRFHLAEGYHQKYYLRQDEALMKEFRARYPSTQDFINSTAAARVNGYLGGNGSAETLAREIDSYGLSPDGRRRLLQRVK